MAGTQTTVEHDGWEFDDGVTGPPRIRQGDLLRFAASQDDLRKSAIIVTADCDLLNRKHASLLTLVPVISVHAALECYVFPDDLQKKLPLIEDFLIKQRASSGTESRETKLDVLRATPEDEVADWASSEQVAHRVLKGSLTRVNKTHYQELTRAIAGKGPSWTKFRDQLRTKGGLLVLPGLKEIGIDESIAWVRPLWQLSLAEVAVRTSEVASRKAERIARLASPYRYRLTQLLGQVFSDIGLPGAADDIDNQIEAFCNE